MDTATPGAAILRLQHLQNIMEARAREIVARQDLDRMTRTARAAGCTDVEIQGALRFVERAAGGH